MNVDELRGVVKRFSSFVIQKLIYDDLLTPSPSAWLLSVLFEKCV